MKKRILSILAVIIVCISCFAPTNVFATEQEDNIVISNKSGENWEIKEQNVSIIEENGEITKTITTEIKLNDNKARSSITDAGATVRITFVVSAQNSGKDYRMTGFKATYTVLDKAFSISSRHIRVYNFGGSDILNSKKYTYNYNPTKNTYNKSFSNLKWVNSSEPGLVGGYAECNISRGGSSWNLQCFDWIVYNDACPV